MGKTGRKERLKKAERERQIVTVAERLFSKRGFRGTTTREIARKARISEATIFKHFRRKEDLYGAIIERYCADESGKSLFIKRLEGKKGGDVFREIAEFLIEKYTEDPFFARLLMRSALERDKFSDIFIKSRVMETLDYLSRHIRSLIRKGEFKRHDPALSARAFLGMVAHYCMLQEIYGFKRFFKRPQKEVVETFVDIFTNGMAKEVTR